MSKPNTSAQSSTFSKYFAALAILILFIVSELVYYFIFGNPKNFIEGNTAKEPIHEGIGSFLGLFYKGGVIVPFLVTAFLTVLTFSIERFMTLGKARGTGSVPDFVRNVQNLLTRNDINGAMAACDKQKGSVANVVRAGLEKYQEMANTPGMATDQKVLAIQKEVEESTSLEMPSLEKNLPILSTIASVGTLIALLGTVIGMIKAFRALAQAGAPDTSALSTGISEALINTALGIGTSAIAIIMYNIFTARIDAMSYGIEEAGFSMTQTFQTQHK